MYLYLYVCICTYAYGYTSYIYVYGYVRKAVITIIKIINIFIVSTQLPYIYSITFAYICSGKFLCYIKEILCMTALTELEDIVLSEISKAQKQKYSMTPLT
jgi:hypothetical protein